MSGDRKPPPLPSERWRLVRSDEDGRWLYEWNPEGADDLDVLFERVRTGRASEDDTALFCASMIDRFIARVFDGDEIEPWILKALARAFMKVLHGGEWNDEVPLPGRPRTPIRPWREERDLQIFSEVSNALARQPAPGVLEAITAAAARHEVSFEAARRAYYHWKNDPRTIDSQNRAKVEKD